MFVVCFCALSALFCVFYKHGLHIVEHVQANDNVSMPSSFSMWDSSSAMSCVCVADMTQHNMVRMIVRKC